ncbi:MAG: hypothetical protein E6K73_00655 [Candidatus Eisenbacteria bacterium]|uniref:Peptidase S8/S53 domain-containing protein n=1 Tax=Eiseniibacteriota bacterium TaxID=2212470 RepID=A0A538SRD9_UNCEI|nr:MAG: hypothetical protein E6K73_00655 [Candidatus Eisenbacteria bacterium]
MRLAPLEARGAVLPGGRPGEKAAMRRAAVLLLGALAFSPVPSAWAGPFIWDEDTDHIDDRMESVNLLGYRFAFQEGDTLARKRIDVSHSEAGLVFSVYVVYDHVPTPSDLTQLSLLGMPVLFRYEGVPAVRSSASFAQVQAAAKLPGVERVEAVPIVYPMLHEAAGSIGARDPSGRVFPTWAGIGGADGSGVVIAFLDTGVNDAPAGSWPGHESLAGRFLGGAVFSGSDSALDTPRDGSVNPEDRGGAVTLAHGTHVASIALGTGGAAGYAVGIAPGARFVDVKVLNDAGTGTGLAEALDWCIHNRARAWGGPPGFEGIDVINMSLSSTDPTDGDDIASRLANRAVDLGLVVVASMGNDGHTAYVPSPAGADRVLAVGAFDNQRSPGEGDDRITDFSNYGPRASDGDQDASDEQKPDLLAPGVAILGADGDESTDGAQYRRLSGTSMAAAFVSGAVAALRSAYPELSPGQIAELLRATAFRRLGGAPPGAAGPDPRWSSPVGFGALDLYAARLEREQPGRSQIVRLELTASPPSEVLALLYTQREMGAGGFVFERAPDENGAPGPFTPYDSVPATGSSSLAGMENRTIYARTWQVTGSERGQAFWYRVSYTEGGVRYDTPSVRLVSPSGPSAATLELTIVHNAYDHDVVAQVVAGDSGGASLVDSGSSVSTPGLVLPVPGSGAAASSEWVTGTSTAGNVAWTFRIEVPHGSSDNLLPPTAERPWQLDVTEGGYLNRSGRITAFRLIWHRSDGSNPIFEGGPVPQQTLEGNTTRVTIPTGTTAVGTTADPGGIRFGPSPVRAGEVVRFSIHAAVAGDLRVYDVAGREVTRVPVRRSGGGSEARWTTRDGAGDPLASGIYFARFGASRGVRVLVVRM